MNTLRKYERDTAEEFLDKKRVNRAVVVKFQDFATVKLYQNDTFVWQYDTKETEDEIRGFLGLDDVVLIL